MVNDIPIGFSGSSVCDYRFYRTSWDSKFASLLDPEEAEMIKETFDLKEFLPLAIASVVIASVV